MCESPVLNALTTKYCYIGRWWKIKWSFSLLLNSEYLNDLYRLEISNFLKTGWGKPLSIQAELSMIWHPIIRSCHCGVLHRDSCVLCTLSHAPQSRQQLLSWMKKFLRIYKLDPVDKLLVWIRHSCKFKTVFYQEEF